MNCRKRIRLSYDVFEYETKMSKEALLSRIIIFLLINFMHYRLLWASWAAEPAINPSKQ